MMKNSLRDWLCHGQFAQSQFMAGVLPHSGVHFLTGSDKPAKEAIIADIATAIASDVVTCGLGPADKSGARTSLSGFFGHPTGASTGVAVITSRERAETIDRAIAASALTRGIRRGLPIAMWGGYSAEASGFRLHELSEWFGREHGVDIGLVIVDAPLPDREVIALSRDGRAVLCVCDVAPGAPDGVILEVGDGRITIAKPAQGAQWAKEFSLDVVKVQETESFVLKPGRAVEPQPIWRAAPVAAVVRVAKEPEPDVQITSKVALIVSRGELDPKVRMKWASQGYDVATNQDAALPKSGEIVGGRREIVIAGEDQLPTELKARATRLNDEAVRRGVADVVAIRVAA